MPKNIGETLKSLFEATSIPEDKQTEFKSIFEAAVKTEAKELAESYSEYVKEEYEAKETELKEKMEEYSEYVQEEYATKLDEYGDYVVEKFMEENKLAIENGVKAGLFDSLMENMRSVFANHNIKLDDEAVDVVEELEDSLSETEQQLAEAKKEIISLKATLSQDAKAKEIREATTDLTESQKEKVMTLAEDIEYDDAFSGTLATLIKTVTVSESRANDENDTLILDEKTDEKPAKKKAKLDWNSAINGGSGFFK